MIEDVISEVRELFLDEGVDEQVLLELKTVTVLSNFLFFMVSIVSKVQGGREGKCQCCIAVVT